MSYLILARKYRPQRFGDLTGQETTSRILQAAIFRNRLASAYLFSGPRGTGKTTTARIFAKAINCSAVQNAEPCGECPSCLEITQGNSIDVLEMDAASHTQVDNIREVVINTVNFAPARDRCRIFIIDEVHMLSNHSFNALLKTLEEPPAHVIFILCTTEFHKIPATVASRCQRFRFLPLTRRQIFATLQKIAKVEKITITDDALSLLAKSAGGSLRDSLSLFDQAISSHPDFIDLKKLEDLLGIIKETALQEFLTKISERDPKGVLECIGKVWSDGYDLSQFLKEVRESFRTMLMDKCGYREQDPSPTPESNLPTDKFTLEELLRDCQLLSKCSEQMRWNDSPRIVLETYSVQLCRPAVGAKELLELLDQPDNKKSPEKKNDPIQSQKEPEPESRSGGPQMLEQNLNPEPPPEADTSSSSGWAKILKIIQESKPSLFPFLQAGSCHVSSGKIELTFSKNFSLEYVKKHQAFLETLSEKVLERKMSLVMNLGKVHPASLEQNDIGLVSDPQEMDAGSETEGGEVYEVVDSKPTVKEFAIEDEGLKTFLELIPGKLTKINDPSS